MRRATRRERALLTRALRAYRGPRLPDGLVRKRRPNPRSFDPDQLAIGTKVELEHTRRPELALEIAMAHLLERSDYYDRLERYVERDPAEPRSEDEIARGMLARYSSPQVAAEMAHWHAMDHPPGSERRARWERIRRTIAALARGRR